MFRPSGDCICPDAKMGISLGQGEGLRPQPREKLPRLWLSAWHMHEEVEAGRSSTQTNRIIHKCYCIHIYIYAHMFICICMYMCICVHVFVYVYVYVYVYILCIVHGCSMYVYV